MHRAWSKASVYSVHRISNIASVLQAWWFCAVAFPSLPNVSMSHAPCLEITQAAWLANLPHLYFWFVYLWIHLHWTTCCDNYHLIGLESLSVVAISWSVFLIGCHYLKLMAQGTNILQCCWSHDWRWQLQKFLERTHEALLSWQVSFRISTFHEGSLAFWMMRYCGYELPVHFLDWIISLLRKYSCAIWCWCWIVWNVQNLLEIY